MNISNLGDMPGFSSQLCHQPPPDSSFCCDQPPHGSSSATVCSSNFDLRFQASSHQSRDENIPITSYSGRQHEIPVNQKYIYNSEASSDFSPHPPPIVFLGPRHPTIFYPKKVMFRPAGEMPPRSSPPVLFPNPHQSQFYHSEQPKPSQYQQSKIPACPQQPAGTSSQQGRQQLPMAHSYQHQPVAHSYQHQPVALSQQHPTAAQKHQQPNAAWRHQQPSLAQKHQQPTMAHSHQQPSLAQKHQQPTIAHSHQQPFMAQTCQQPNMAHGHRQSTSLRFQKPRSMPPLYRYPLPHQSHPQPAHLNRPQLTPNSFNMSNMPRYFQNIRKKALSDMNYRNLVKVRALREEFGGINGAGIGLSSYSPVPVIQKVGPPKQNIISKSKKLEHVGSINTVQNVNDNGDVNELMGSENEEEIHLIKTGQELARMCFGVEVGCQTDLSFPLDAEIVMMPVEALNGFITAPQEDKSQVEQGERGSNVLLKPETPNSETTTTMEVPDESTKEVEIKPSFLESSLVAPPSDDKLQDLNQYGKNAIPDHLLLEDSNKLACEQNLSKESRKTDCTDISKDVKQNQPTNYFVQMSQEEQTQRGKTQSPNLLFNISNSDKEQAIPEKPCVQDLCSEGEISVSESTQENENFVHDPQSKQETDSQNCSDFAYKDIEDKVESFNPLANFATLMSYTDPYIEDELSFMNQHTSSPSGAKLFEQDYSEVEHQSDQYNFEKASYSEQVNSGSTFHSDQVNSGSAFHSEQVNSENAFHSELYNSDNGKDKLVDHIPEILSWSIEEPNLDHKKTENLEYLANIPSTSTAVIEEPSNVSKSSHTSTIICRNPNSKNITSENKVDSRNLSLSWINGKTSECLNSFGELQTDSEDLRPSTSKKRCQSGLAKSDQKYKLKQTSRQKYKVKNSAGTGINLKPDIASRMSSDQYEHPKVGNESIQHKPRKLSDDISINWNIPLLDALNVTEKCGYVAGITSLKQENIQCSVRKQTQDTANECSSKSQKKRSSRGRLLKKKRFYDDHESIVESNGKEYKDHHGRAGKRLNTSSEELYSPSIEKKCTSFPFPSSSNQEKDSKNEHDLEGKIENNSPDSTPMDVVSDEKSRRSPDPLDLSAESFVIKMVSQGKFKGIYNNKEYVGNSNSFQKSPSKTTISTITSKANVNVPKLDVQLEEKDSDPFKIEDKCKDPSEVFEVKLNESAKEDKSDVQIKPLGDNELGKNKIISTEDFTSDKTSSRIDKTNCKIGYIGLRLASKANHQEKKKSKEAGKKMTKQEENKSFWKKKFHQSKEMDKKNTSMITKQLKEVFLEVRKDSDSAEFYFGIDEARPTPMYYKIDNLEIDLKSVEMKLENELYADAEQFLEDFRNIVKTSIDHFGPIHKISERSKKVLDLACGLVSKRNLNLPSCPKFDLMEILNDDSNHPVDAKRQTRAAKRKTREKSKICSSKIPRDESPDHVCEECGTIFAHLQSYTRHCRAKSGCAKALNRGRQMVGHTMQINQSPPRDISNESPERIHFNLDDLVDLATAPPGHGDQLLKTLDREIVSCKRTVQKNKFLSALRRKARDRDVEPYRVPFQRARINARWTNDELLLAEEGVRNFGKNFKTIAQVLGTKTGSQVRRFFVNYRRKYNLDSAYKEYVAEYASTNDRHVDKEKEGSRTAGTSKRSRPHISKNKLRNETFTCKQCNLQFSSEDALEDHIEVDWPECGQLFGRDNPSGDDENDVSRNDVPVSHPPSQEGKSSLKPLSRRKKLPNKNVGFIPSVPRGVPVVSHPQEDIVIDADDDNFEPPGLRVRSFVNVNANS